MNNLVEGLLGWLRDHGLGKQWEKRNKAAGCFSKESGPRPCHPLGYGVMIGRLLASTSQGFSKGKSSNTKGSFRLDGGMEH